MRQFCLFFSALLLFTTTTGFAQLTPPYDWQVMRTEHFRIIYHPEVAGLAAEAALVAEDAYTQWSQELNTIPPKLTNIVIIDFDDSVNGFADNVNLHSWEFTSQLQYSATFGGRFPSPIGGTIIHEYWHIADLSVAAGISAGLRHAFGNLIMPNDMKPWFNIEGSATYSEYLAYGYGRSNWALDGMYMRQMALDNGFPPLDRAAHRFSNMAWPRSGTLAYGMGAWFMRYIEDGYGRGMMGAFDHINAKDWWSTLSFLLEPLLNEFLGVGLYVGADFGRVMAQATGAGAAELYQGFQAWVKAQAAEHLQRVQAEGVTLSQKLTDHGYWTNQPKWSPDGAWIAYGHSDPFRRGGIRLVRPGGTDDQALVNAVLLVDHAFDWSPDGTQIVYANYDQVGPYVNVNDLYLVEVDTGTTTRLTRGLRAFNPVFIPDGQAVLFAENQGGDLSPRLMQFDLASGQVELIKEFPADTFVDYFALSPDGTQLALSVWKRPGYLDLYTMTLDGGELRPVTQDLNEDFRPEFSPDGQYVLFDSIRDETFNLFAYRLDDGQLSKVSNVVSGAFSPTVSPDGTQLAFLGYGSRGYDLHLMPYAPSDWKPVSFPHETIPAWEGYPSVDLESKRYNALATMLPKYWQPQVTASSIGGLVDAWDALYRQYYAVDGGWDWEEKAPYGSFFYLDEALLSPVGVSLGAGVDPWGNWQFLALEVSPVDEFFRTHTFSFGVDRSDYDGVFYTLSGAWDYYERLGIDRSWTDFNLSLSDALGFDPNSDDGSMEAVLDLRTHSRLPIFDLKGPHQLSSKLTWGWSNTPDNFTLGGERGRFMVRGHPRGALSGQRALAASLEYRFPIIAIESGWKLTPFFLDDVRGALFADLGSSTNTPGLSVVGEDWTLGVGIEFELTLTTGTYYRRTLTVGGAYGMGEDGPAFYLEYGVAF